MADTIIPKDIAKDELKQMAYKVFKDLATVSRSAVEQFYSDYTPEIYKRVFGLYDIYTPRIEIKDNEFLVEFRYSSNFVSVSQGDPNAAFYKSFIQGAHGGDYYYGHMKKSIPITHPSPWDIIKEFATNYKV